MRFKLFLVLAAIALLWGGGQGVYTAMTNSTPTTMSVQSYIKDKPSTKWLHLTGGKLNMLDANVSTSRWLKTIKELYIPLAPADASFDETVHILVFTKDPKLLELAKQMNEVKTEEEATRLASEHADELIAERDIEGLVSYGIESKDSEKEKLRELNANLADDFIVIEENKRPSWGLSAWLFALGLLMVVGFIVTLARRSSKTDPESTAEEPTASDAPPTM